MILLLFITAASVQCPDETGNQGSINYCAEKELQRSDAQLSLRLKQTLKIAAKQDGKGETYAVDTLKVSQKAWFTYRDAQCRVESAPVLSSADSLVIHELIDEEHDAFLAALRS